MHSLIYVKIYSLISTNRKFKEEIVRKMKWFRTAVEFIEKKKETLNKISNKIFIKKKKDSKYYHLEPSSISGALYHLVATYSVKVGSEEYSFPCSTERANPKSANFNSHRLFIKIFEG